jgi:hypothetical protein
MQSEDKLEGGLQWAEGKGSFIYATIDWMPPLEENWRLG